MLAKVSRVIRIDISDILLLTPNILLEHQINIYGTFDVP